jgi:hypothetical protein
MKTAAMHNVQSGCRVILFKMFSHVYGYRQAVLSDPNTQQTSGQGEPTMPTGGILIRFIVFGACPIMEQREKRTS